MKVAYALQESSVIEFAAIELNEGEHMKRASKTTPQIREDKKDQKQEMPWFQEEFDVHRGFIFQQHVRKDVHSTALAV